ncbi:MAG: MFS transporter, partial [Bacteroidota bacterium]
MSSYQRNAFIYSTIVAMGGFVFGLDAALISGTVKFIAAEFSLNDLQLGTAVSAPGLGVLLALPIAGYASNMLGRKKTLQIIAILYLVSAISSALAPSFLSLVAARFLGGLAFSSITLSSMYIGEIAPSKWRGKLVSMIQINIVIGLSAAYFINYLIIQAIGSGADWAVNLGITKYTWRWMLGSEVLPALVWLGLLFLIPKSPNWLVYRDRIKDAEKALSKIVPEQEIQPKISEIQQGLKENTNNRSIRSQLKEIFGKSMRTIFIVGITIAIVQQATGINAILFYAPTIIEQLGIGTDAAFLQTIWIGLTGLVFTILSLLLIDRIGRRPMILLGLVWIFISLGICSYGFYGARYTLEREAISTIDEISNAERLQPLAGREFKSDVDFKQALIEVLGEEE